MAKELNFAAEGNFDAPDATITTDVANSDLQIQVNGSDIQLVDTNGNALAVWDESAGAWDFSGQDVTGVGALTAEEESISAGVIRSWGNTGTYSDTKLSDHSDGGAAAQAVFDAIPAEGGEVKLPRRKMLVSQSLEPLKNGSITLLGTGYGWENLANEEFDIHTWFRTDASIDQVLHLNQGDRTKHHSAEIGKFGIAAHDATNGIHIDRRVEDSYFHDIMVFAAGETRSTGRNLRINVATQMHDVVFERVYLESAETQNLHMSGDTPLENVTFRDCIFYNAQTNQNIRINFNTFEPATKRRMFTFERSTINNAHMEGLFVQGAANFRVRDCYFFKNSDVGAGQHSDIHLDHCHRGIIDGNSFQVTTGGDTSNADYAIELHSCQDCVVNGDLAAPRQSGFINENGGLRNIINGVSTDVEDPSAGVKESGTATSGSWSEGIEDTDKTWTSDEWNEYRVAITGGTGAGQERRIQDTNSDNIPIYGEFETVPDSTSTYEITPRWHGEGREGVQVILDDRSARHAFIGGSWGSV